MGIEGLLMNLPSPIIFDILSRLPTKTIIQCRCVCKTWLKLISEPDFGHFHLLRSPTCFLVNNLFSSSAKSGFFNLVELEDEPDHHDLQYVAGSKLDGPKGRERNGLTMIGSINGLVCLNDFQYDAVYLWNPTTREYIIVQTPEGEGGYPNITSYGFGLSSIKGEYKAIRIFQDMEIADSLTRSRRIRNSTCHVYTIGEGSWRSIGHAPFKYNCREQGIFLNGNLHWLIDDPEGSELISCLDIETELFHPFPPPLLSKGNQATLNLYGGCLSICDNSSEFDIAIWVMKEYGVRKSWCKETVISKYHIGLVGQFREVVLVHIIKAFKDGEILLLWRDLFDLLLFYNPQRETFQVLDARDLIGAIKKRTCCLEERNPSIEAVDFVSSFLSLKNFGLEMVNKV